MSRDIAHVYRDPLDAVWLECASRIGLRVVRTADAFATSDGSGTLALGTAETLDADDCVAQMIFHELCHSLVQGPDSFDVRDWGLDNETERDQARENGCLRLQALLARPHGLRRFFAPTTDHRTFYDALPEDPLAVRGPGEEREVVLARRGAAHADRSPWAPHLEGALVATQRIAAAVAAASGGAAGEVAGPPTLYAAYESPPPRQEAGLPAATGDAAKETCGTCAWRTPRGVCRELGQRRVRAEWKACERWERALDCLTCGACCREAYGAVVVQPRDPARKRHPELIVRRDNVYEVRRDGDRCAALHGGAGTPYTCAIYDERPKTCRDFARGGAHCLTARQRVGLSR